MTDIRSEDIVDFKEVDARPVDVPSWAGGRSGYVDQDEPEYGRHVAVQGDHLIDVIRSLEKRLVFTQESVHIAAARADESEEYARTLEDRIKWLEDKLDMTTQAWYTQKALIEALRREDEGFA